MMHRTKDIDEVMRFAVCSIVASEVEDGCAALRWVLRQDPDNESARAWLDHCAEEYSVRPCRHAAAAQLQPAGPLAA